VPRHHPPTSGHLENQLATSSTSSKQGRAPPMSSGPGEIQVPYTRRLVHSGVLIWSWPRSADFGLLRHPLLVLFRSFACSNICTRTRKWVRNMLICYFINSHSFPAPNCWHPPQPGVKAKSQMISERICGRGR